MKNNCDFINEPTKKALFKMFIPLMIGMILNFVYNIVDSLWIGNLLGDTALSALASATPIVTLTFSFGMGITNGMGILLSGKLSKNDKKEEESIVSTTLIITLLLSVVLVVVLEFSLGGILKLIKTGTETFHMAKSYLTWYLIGMIPSYLFCHLTSMLRCYGDSIFQMISMIITSIVNAILDPILIKIMGIQGAAIATVFSQFLSLLLLIIYCLKKKYFKINLKSFKKEYILPVTKLSVPTVIQQCTPSISSLVLTACVSGFGDIAMAGYEIVNKLDMILYMPAMVFNMVLTPIIAFCIGESRRDRAKDYMKTSIIFSIAFVVVFGSLVLIFAKDLAGMFGCSNEAAELVQHVVWFLVWGYLLNAITQCYMGQINGYGQPAKGMIITVLNHIVIRIPFSIILSQTALGLDGIWITLLISFVASFICVVFINKHVTKKANSISSAA